MTWSMWIAVIVLIVALAGFVLYFWDLLRKPPGPRW
jgi:hypothetical protein